VPPSLGTGAELHGAFCLAAGTTAYLSQHIGDLDTDEAMTAYRTALDRAERLFGVAPELVGHDLHPDFSSTRLAEDLGLPRLPVQHHHAHVASVMAEHRLDGRVLGVAYDGFGLGTDGSAWGGELLVCDAISARRVGHLRPVALPGGDAAVRSPWRMLLSHAEAAGIVDDALASIDGHVDEIDTVLGLIRSATGPSTTSSMGRLFDAVAAALRIADASTYEGHPAILLEQAADPAEARPYPFEVDVGEDGVLLDPRPTVGAIVRDHRRGRPREEIAGRFHRTIAAATLEACRAVRETTGLRRVCLSGGVFANDLLTSDLAARLEAAGFDVFLPRRAPVGAGGLALGQVLVANASLAG
jgi:hydrogenase maturation protein HypF